MDWERDCELAKAFESRGVLSVRAWERWGFDRQAQHDARHMAMEAERLTYGVWVSPKRLPSATELVAHVMSQLAPRAVVGLRSAAALHGLLEAPEAVDLVLPRGAWRTRASWPFAHRCFVVTSRAEGDQVVTAPLEPGLSLSSTSAPRTLVDLVRFRRAVAPRLAALALRRFLDLGGDLDGVRALAWRLRAKTGLRHSERLALAFDPPARVTDCRPFVFPTGFPERTPPLFCMR